MPNKSEPSDPIEEAAIAAVTTTEMLRTARREVHMRLRVYPGFVAKGKLKPDEAQREIRAMTAIVRRLEKELEAENAQGKML